MTWQPPGVVMITGAGPETPGGVVTTMADADALSTFAAVPPMVMVDPGASP